MVLIKHDHIVKKISDQLGYALTAEFDTEVDIPHNALSDMPDITGTNTDHDARYYTEAEIDNTFANYTLTSGLNISNWNAAYGWGDHSTVGYLTVETDPVWISEKGEYYTRALLNAGQLDNRYFTETEVDTEFTNYLKKDGTTPLTGNWDIGTGKYILAESIMARTAAGLILKTAGGNTVATVKDDNSFEIQNNLYVKDRLYMNTDDIFTAPNKGIFFRPTTGSWFKQYADGTKFYWGKSSAIISAIDYSNSNYPKFGIGTTSPAVSLDLVSNISTSSPVIATRNDEGEYSYFLTMKSGDATNKGKTYIQNLNSKAILLKTNGNVGIGTEAPNAKLQVVGDTRLGDQATNYTEFTATGDQTFTGSAGFYPRTLSQAAEPAAGTGATQLDTGEMCIWIDTDDSKCYYCYNQAGTVKIVELT